MAAASFSSIGEPGRLCSVELTEVGSTDGAFSFSVGLMGLRVDNAIIASRSTSTSFSGLLHRKG